MTTNPKSTTETIQRIISNTPPEQTVAILAAYVIGERHEAFRLGLGWSELKQSGQKEKK